MKIPCAETNFVLFSEVRGSVDGSLTAEHMLYLYLTVPDTLEIASILLLDSCFLSVLINFITL